ncbi:hypothetical protein GJ496_002681, partial [Pomphorhynchus laevis]
MVRWALTLLQYNYDIQYIRGTENVLADILSRFAIEEYQVGSSEEEFISLIQDAALTDLQLTREQIRNESLVDPELKQIRRYLESWWPNGCNHEDVLLWLQRIVIPTSCRQKSAHVLHTGHPGINTMKELARRYCWWPSIETDIEHTVGTCQLCQSRRNAAPEVPLHQWDVPMQPWERLHVDFAGPVAGRLFILVIDAYSHWPEIEEIINTSASETIKKLRKRMVQTFKRRVDMSEGNLELTLAQFLMTYRNTKQSSTGVSPAVLMFGRRLSTIWDRLRPRKVQKTQHNIRAQPRSFMVSQSVWLRDTQRKRWEPGYIMSKNGSESYTVDTPAGPRRRHVNDIRNRLFGTTNLPHYSVNTMINYSNVGKICNTENFTKQEIKQVIKSLYEFEDLQFSGLAGDDVFYKSPDRLRLPLIFYYGHTSCVFINKMRIGRLIEYDERINFSLDKILETGVDEMSWDDTESTRLGKHLELPSVNEIREYRQNVLDLIMKVIDRTDFKLHVVNNTPLYNICMGMEHFRIHIETSAMLIAQLPISMVKRPAGWIYGPLKIPNDKKVENKFLSIEEGNVRLGKPYDFPSFGWDNEYGKRIVSVNPFKISKFKITNEEFLEFVNDNGYTDSKYWCEEGIAWLKFTKRTHPIFWICNKACKTSCGTNIDIKTHCNFNSINIQESDISSYKRPEFNYKYRLLFDIVDMPENWPVNVNYYEAKAYCRWKGQEFRLPCEAEFRLIQKIAISPNSKCDPVMETRDKYNIYFKYGSCTPVNLLNPNKLGVYDECGNVWEWIEDDFDALPMSVYSKYYGDFSTPCYDGKHKIILGGSFASTGTYASHFARVGFRPHFQQFAGFRLLCDPSKSNDKLIRKISDKEPTSVWIYSLDNQNIVDHCRMLENLDIHAKLYDYIQTLLTNDKTSNAETNVLVHYGCGTGQLTERLSKFYKETIGIDVQSILIKKCLKQPNSTVIYKQ